MGISASPQLFLQEVISLDFADAYDTTNHSLLMEILLKYECHPKLCSVIKRMYQDLLLQKDIMREKKETPQTVGMRQGDNLSKCYIDDLLLVSQTFSLLSQLSKG